MARISKELEAYRTAKAARDVAEKALHDAALALVERIETDHPAIRRRPRKPRTAKPRKASTSPRSDARS